MRTARVLGHMSCVGQLVARSCGISAATPVFKWYCTRAFKRVIQARTWMELVRSTCGCACAHIKLRNTIWSVAQHGRHGRAASLPHGYRVMGSVLCSYARARPHTRMLNRCTRHVLPSTIMAQGGGLHIRILPLLHGFDGMNGSVTRLLGTSAWGWCSTGAAAQYCNQAAPSAMSAVSPACDWHTRARA